MDLLEVFAPILTKGRTDDGILWVEGKITGPDLDADFQRMDPVWLKTAVPEWAVIGNVREQHQHRAVGKAVEVWDTPDGSWYMRAKIVDREAAQKVEHGVYTGFSIGVKNATLVKTSEAPMGLVKSGKIVETSLADRPCLPTCSLTFAKADAAGDLQPLDMPVSVELTKAEQLAAAAGLLASRYTVTKADDESKDIVGARAAIAAISPLIQSEIDGLTAGEQSEQYDVSCLLTALAALTSFLASEVAESQEDKMDEATKQEIAELVKVAVPTLSADEVRDIVKAQLADETWQAELTKAIVPAEVEPPDIAKMVTDAVTAAVQPLSDSLANVVTKVDSIPVGGGPAITRTAQTADPNTAKQQWLSYANTPGLSQDLREKALAKAESL